MIRTPIGLLLSIFRENRIPDIFSHIGKFDEAPQEAGNSLNFIECPPSAVCSFRLVPAYLNLVVRDPGRDIVKIPHQNWGYAIDLRGCKTVDEYLEKQFNSKYRSIIRRYVSRLESCFQTEYILHQEEISEETYRSLMHALKIMIDRRFEQRKESHKEQKIWDELLKQTYALIRENKASLFVIYADGQPIEISLNYHFNGVLFSSISSYDIDYSKFGLGHVEIYKQLQWCLANGYQLFEMGVGGMDYKRRWSNHIYQFEHWVIFRKQLPQSIIAYLEIGKIRIKEYLKAKKINELLVAGKNKLGAGNRTGPEKEGPKIDPVDIASVCGDWQNIDWRADPHAYLRNHVFDFLYAHVEKKGDVAVLQSALNRSQFLIKGKNKAQHLQFP